MIYYLTGFEDISDEVLERLMNKLPEGRLAKAQRYIHREGRITCTLGYILFLYGYRNYCGYDDLPEFTEAESLKPYIDGRADVHFNISHCRGGVACIFGKDEVGIDIQDIRGNYNSIIDKICTAEETAEINSAGEDERARRFIRLWTIKEAISKLTGEGVFRDIRQIYKEDFKLLTLPVDESIYMTGASGDEKDFELTRLDIESLLML